MSTVPGETYAPWRTVAGGTTRTLRSAQPDFSGILSWYSYGPSSIVSIRRTRKYRRIAFLAHSLTCHAVGSSPSAPGEAGPDGSPLKGTGSEEPRPPGA